MLTQFKQPSRLRRFSLRFLLGLMTLIAVLFGIVGYRKNQITQHMAAISVIEENGGRLILTQWRGNSSTIIGSPEDAEDTMLSMLWAVPSVSIPHVDLSDHALSANTIRSLMPYLQKIIPRKDENEDGKAYVGVLLSGNPNIHADFVDEMQESLPNCRIFFQPQE